MVSAAGLAISVVGFATGVLRPAESFTDNWWIYGLASAVTITAIGSAITGVVALIRTGDRSVGVVLATTVGLLFTVLLIREVLQGLG